MELDVLIKVRQGTALLESGEKAVGELVDQSE